MTKKRLATIDFNSIALGYVAFTVMWLVTAEVHEQAHKAICESFGNNGHINHAGIQATSTPCIGRELSSSEADLFHAVGGLAGTGIAAAPLITRKRFLIIGCLPFVPSQFENFLGETFAYAWYIDDNNEIMPTISSLTAFFISVFLAYWYGIKKAPPLSTSQ